MLSKVDMAGSICMLSGWLTVGGVGITNNGGVELLNGGVLDVVLGGVGIPPPLPYEPPLPDPPLPKAPLPDIGRNELGFCCCFFCLAALFSPFSD